MNDRGQGYGYPERVRFEIAESDFGSYCRAADFLNVNDADVLYVMDRLAAGIRYTYVEPIYTRSNDAPGDPPEGRPDNLVHRVGILAAYSIVKNPGARLDTANAVLLAQWHLMHRWRTGEDVTGALPFIALALQLRGNLLAE